MAVAPVFLKLLPALGVNKHLVVKLFDDGISFLDLSGCASRAKKRLHLDQKLPPGIFGQIKIDAEVALHNARRLGTEQSLEGYASLRVPSSDGLESRHDLSDEGISLLFELC